MNGPTRKIAASIQAATIVLLGLTLGAEGTLAQPEERDPLSELIVLYSGSVEGNLEPCG